MASLGAESTSGASLTYPWTMSEARWDLDGFAYLDGHLFAEDVTLERLANAVGTPTYVYSAGAIRSAYERMHAAFAPLGARLHYAVKACPNLHILGLLHELGAGMDVVSGGELERAWLAGVPMDAICFAGVGKTDAEIRAALDGTFSPLAMPERGLGRGGERHLPPGLAQRGPVGLFNVESASELARIAALADTLGTRARIAVRINPDVDAHTHTYTTTGKRENKFGVTVDHVLPLFERYADHPAVDLVGLHVHIGSPVRAIEPFEAAVDVVLGLVDRLAAHGHRVSLLDLGGGWAVDYESGEAPVPSAYAERLVPRLAERVAGQGMGILIEPGRSLVANAGVLMTRVQHTKEGQATRFVVCDAGVHTLIRPALYQAFHFIWPVAVRAEHVPLQRVAAPEMPDLATSEVVGPICESSDFLAQARPLPRVARGDLLAVFSAGAYGMAMASNINDHMRPAEVLVDGGQATVIAARQRLVDHLAPERQKRALTPAELEPCNRQDG